MATFDEILKAYTDLVAMKASEVEDSWAGIGKAASLLLGHIPAKVHGDLDELSQAATRIEKVRDLRELEKLMNHNKQSLWLQVRDIAGLLEHNKDYATGRAKRTHQDAIDALRRLNYQLDDFFKCLSAPQEAIRLEQWLIDNNKW